MYKFVLPDLFIYLLVIYKRYKIRNGNLLNCENRSEWSPSLLNQGLMFLTYNVETKLDCWFWREENRRTW